MLKPKRKRFRWFVNFWTKEAIMQQRFFRRYGKALRYYEQMVANNFIVHGIFDKRTPPEITEDDIDYYYRSYYGF